LIYRFALQRTLIPNYNTNNRYSKQIRAHQWDKISISTCLLFDSLIWRDILPIKAVIYTSLSCKGLGSDLYRFIVQGSGLQASRWLCSKLWSTILAVQEVDRLINLLKRSFL
jgi:hypothetical protein